MPPSPKKKEKTKIQFKAEEKATLEPNEKSTTKKPKKTNAVESLEHVETIDSLDVPTTDKPSNVKAEKQPSTPHEVTTTAAQVNAQ